MNKFILKLSLLVFCAAVSGLPVQLRAADANQVQGETKPTKTKKNNTVPFQGKLKSVDQTAKTIAVGERVIRVTAETKVTRDGKPALLADGVVGDKVAGAYRKADDGALDATTVKFSTEKEKTKKAATKKDEPQKEM